MRRWFRDGASFSTVKQIQHAGLLPRLRSCRRRLKNACRTPFPVKNERLVLDTKIFRCSDFSVDSDLDFEREMTDFRISLCVDRSCPLFTTNNCFIELVLISTNFRSSLLFLARYACLSPHSNIDNVRTAKNETYLIGIHSKPSKYLF